MDDKPVVFSCNHECSQEDLSTIQVLDGVIVLCPICYKLAVGNITEGILLQALHEHMQLNLKFES